MVLVHTPSRATPLVRNGAHSYAGISGFQGMSRTFTVSDLSHSRSHLVNAIVSPRGCSLLNGRISLRFSMRRILVLDGSQGRSMFPTSLESDRYLSCSVRRTRILYAPRGRMDPYATSLAPLGFFGPRDLDSLLEAVVCPAHPLW